MDPNDTLRIINDSHDAVEIEKFCGYLYAWISLGGFQPEWKNFPIGYDRYRKRFAIPNG